MKLNFILIPFVVLGLFAVQVALWAMDREPPFKSGVATVYPTTSPGVLRIERNVRRDVSRNCSVTFSRYIIDSSGARSDLFHRPQYMSIEQRREIQRLAPNKLIEVVQIPAGLKPGKARLYTNLVYECNPLHIIWPIEVLGGVELEIVS